MPFEKYTAFKPIDIEDRQWPSKVLDQAPRWCSVDLRDGNQALIDPMTVEEKLQMWELLLSIGFAEIEVGFPAASQPDFDFIRRIIEEDRIPDGVSVQILCQAREELIQRSVEALEGAKSVIFHLYNSTSELQRRVVFGMDRQGIIDLAVSGTEIVKQGLAGFSGHAAFEYSPESFTGTELDFAAEICTAVADTWGASEEDPMIINLPSTVEMSTPNIYADQIEWFCRHFERRKHAVISLHTHNDRGTGVAATELGLMAGAQRVEGTLFGNGERTGNCDLVTMAMNLFSQGVDPMLDLRAMPDIRKTVEAVNKLAVHERHPYAGDLVFTAFSGSHQDAIKKGMAQVDRSHWEVPYLPIDPEDVGGSYKETVRVNSQSGKGGVGFLLEEHFGLTLPRDLLVEFSGCVQQLTEELDREVKPDEIYQALLTTYAVNDEPYQLLSYDLLAGKEQDQRCIARVCVADNTLTIDGEGSGPLEAFVNAMVETLNEPLVIAGYQEQSMGSGSDAQAICILSIEGDDQGRCFGIGLSRNTMTASLNAIISAMNRRWAADR
ncbi:MAG TPA: 2-isopropylmalate synthase [Gammaproteobacteria bacterium]|nr:MAG: 2-isopropylmalate synthase [Gammaproteobacteria bacterium TMED134]RZO71348.1 MAG: 2-isopropylmalate synthase [OM182 bacterium]HAL42849.1 2-isopropylmalate synthase [Gammaproteobacteria bacterium]|tara:strand:+ start:9572 stop:11224 length:1653 start_codon:yes stop_codon:yes gene_type:complete